MQESKLNTDNHEIQFNFENKIVTYQKQICLLSVSLIDLFLKESGLENHEEVYRRAYINILTTCMPTSIGYLLFRQKGFQSALAIFAELEKSYKYQMLLTLKEYLRNLKKKHVKEQNGGKGYREIIKQPIAN